MSTEQLIINVRFLRHRKNLSQESVALSIESDRKVVSQWETGWCLPQTDDLIKLSELYGITIDDLVREDMTQSDQFNKEWYKNT